MRAVHAIRRRLREESGFTLIEMLVASVIGTAILLVAFGMLDATVRTFGSSAERTDVAQRGRLAMDTVTQRLRSPVCLEDLGNSAVLSADADGITFWSDITGSRLGASDAIQPVVRELRVSGGVLSERLRATPGGTITSQREIATGVSRIGTTPHFRYYALSPATTPPRQANVALGSPVASGDLRRVARITVALQIDPTSPENAKSAAEFTNDVYLRSIDASDTLGAIRCTAR